MGDSYGEYSDRLYSPAKFESCLVPIRREFYRIPCLLKKEQLKNSKAYQVLQLMRPFFHEKKQLAYHTHKENLVQRRLHVKSLMDKFYAYLENINFPQGHLRATINNALKLKTRVYRLFEDGRVLLTNNSVEQARYCTLSSLHTK